MFCEHCGNPIPEGARFCPSCGTPAPVSAAPQQPVWLPETAPAQPARPARIPWHSRGLLSPERKPGVRRGVNVLFVAALVILQIVLLLVFSNFDGLEPDPLIAQAVGLLPTLVLIVYIFCLDSIEKEPPGLLLLLFLVEGAVCCTLVLAVEVVLNMVFTSFMDESTVFFRLIDAVFLVALVEELGKYLVLKLLTWKSKAFNYRFDGVVYAAVTALGFAAFENVQYISAYGLATALQRSVTAVPGHCVDGILMGLFYGQAKVYEARGDLARSKRFRRLAVLAPVLEHGFYDFVAGTESELVATLFFGYILLLNATVFVLVWRQSQKDEAVALPEQLG